MKKLVMVLQFAIVVGVFSSTFDDYTIITEEWPPYNYLEDGAIKGFSYEVIKYIMSDLNISAKVKFLSDVRANNILEHEKRVIFFSLFRTPEREDKYKWIGPISTEKLYFYKKRGTALSINNLADARKVKRIAVRSSGLIYDYLKSNDFDNLDPSNDNRSLYLKVINRRDSLAVGETLVGVRYILRDLGVPVSELEETSVNVLNCKLYIAASKDIPNSEIKLWQNSLDKFKYTGEFDKLYQQYLN